MTVPPGYHYMQPPDPTRPRVRFEAIEEAWNLFRQQMGPWIGATLIFLALIGVFYIAWIVWVLSSGIIPTRPVPAGGPPPMPNLGPTTILLLTLFGIVLWLLVAFLMAGMFRMAVRQARGERISMGDLFSAGDAWLRVLGAYILVSMVGMVGFFLLILPAFIFAGLLMLTFPLIVDQRVGMMEAMQRSWDALKKEWLMAALFYVVVSLLAGIGVYLLGIGLLFTFPLFFLSLAVVYRDFFLMPPILSAPPPMPAFDIAPAGTAPPSPPDVPTG